MLKVTHWAVLAIVLGVGVPCATRAAEGAEEIAQARKLLDGRDWTGALQAAEDILAVEPGDPQAHYIAGVAALNLGRLNEAERHLDKTLRAAPGAPEVDYQLGTVLLAMADEYFGRGKERIALGLCSEALGHFDKELERSPHHSGALAGRARTLLRAGRTGEALKAYETWIATHPDKPDPYLELIRLYADAGRSSEALSLLDELPSAPPGEVAEATYLVARTLYEKGDDAEGRRLLGELRELPAEPWQLSALEVLNALGLGRFHAAAGALLALTGEDPPAGELEFAAHAYHERYGEILRAGEAQEGAGGPGIDSVPRLILRVSPKYPADAERYGIEGRVLLLAIVNDDGSVGKLSVISVDASRHPSIYERQFRDTALDAVRKWKYSPAMQDGKPTAFPVTISLSFTKS